MTSAADVARLADLAFAEASRWPARSHQRRAAAHLWASAVLPGGRTVAGVRSAVLSFGATATQQAALELLGKITAELGQAA